MSFFFEVAGGASAQMEEEGRALLRTVLSASAAVTFITALLQAALTSNFQLNQLWPVVILVSFQLACFWALTRFKPQTVAVGYLLVVTLLLASASIVDRGVQGQTYYSLVLVQIIAALVFERRTAFGFALLSIVAGIPLILSAERHTLIELSPRPPLAVWLTPVSAFLLVTFAISSVHRRLRAAVVNAFDNAQKLSEANNALRIENARRQEAEQRAWAASQTKSAFLANMSHELRTPMNAVVALTDLLLRDDVSPTQRQHLETILTSSEGLLQLLNGLLDLSKIEAGALTLERIPVQIPSLFDGVRRLFEPIAHAKGIALVFELSPSVPTVLLTDPTRLRQVLGNLVSNAIKFTEKGQVLVQGSWADNRLFMRVTDTGVGIAKSHLESLFRPFSQGDPSTTRRFGGTGLGLVIVARLSELLGGGVAVETEPGAGSVFSVNIDAPIADSAQLGAPVAEQLPVLDPTKRLLLAEDNPVNQKVALRLLERLGLKADLAENGRQAFELAKGGTYDLVLMDLQMPELDGLEAIRLIRSVVIRQPVIIALTANAMAEDERACREAGADGFLSKPVKLHGLATMLAQHLSGPKRSE